MVRRALYEPVRVSEAMLFRLEKRGAFQPMPGNQPSYPLGKDAAFLVSQMELVQPHAVVNELGIPLGKDVAFLVSQMELVQPHAVVNEFSVLMGPVFIGDSLDRAALVVWAAMVVIVIGHPDGPLANLLRLFLLRMFVPTERPLAVPLGSSVPVFRGSESLGEWEAAGPKVDAGKLRMAVAAPPGRTAEFEGLAAWLMLKRPDGSEVPLAPGAVKGGQVSFEVDLRSLGIELDRAVLKDPGAVGKRFSVRLVPG